MAQSTTPPKSAPPVDARPAERRRDRRPVPSSRLVRPPRPHPVEPAPSRWAWLRRAGGDSLSRADQERAKERLTFLALSGVLVITVLLVGGALLWDKVILAQRPVARLDGQAISLRAYTDVLAFRQNLLLAEFQQAQQLASQPPPSGADPSQPNVLQQLAQQRLSQIQNQLAGLGSQLVDDLINDRLIRAEAAKRDIVATPEEVDQELKELVGYQDPNATPAPAPTVAPSETAPAEAAEEGGAVITLPTPPESTAAATATAGTSPQPAESFQSLYRDFRRMTAGTDAIIRADVEMQILRRELNEQLAAAVPTSAEQVHVRHILVPDETAAKAVLERLNNGESFEALAAELST
ncbi:MAG: peptidylprolyl isomerase, partial [Chloroflexota bacterium]